MKQFIVLILVISAVHCQAQFRCAKTKHRFLGFLRMQGAPPDMRMIRNSPSLSTIAFSNHNQSYWQSAGYTSYSENGRIRTTHLFDVTGNLRETRSSISLRREGRWSYWRIQFSPQRSRPLIIYTIH